MTFEKGFIRIAPAAHHLKGFDCGKPEMNQFLTRFAFRHSGLISETWVLTSDNILDNKKKQVAAYYTLCNSTVRKDEIPLEGSLSQNPIPIVLLARLATDLNYQGQGLGEKTLITALRKAAEITKRGLPAPGLVLDVLDDDALKFYKRFELFEEFTDDPMRLFVPMPVVLQI